MLPLVAALQAACAWQLRDRSRAAGRMPETRDAGSAADTTPSGLHVLAGSTYLQQLAAVVLLGTLGAMFIDYVFMVQVKATFEEGPGLGRFFSLYYATISLLTFIVQMLGSRLILEKLGPWRRLERSGPRGGRGRRRQPVRAGLQQHRAGSRQRGRLPQGAAPHRLRTVLHAAPTRRPTGHQGHHRCRHGPSRGHHRRDRHSGPALAARRTADAGVARARGCLRARCAGRRQPTDPRLCDRSRTEPARSQRGGGPLRHRGWDDPHGGPAHAAPREAGSRPHPGRGSRGPRDRRVALTGRRGDPRSAEHRARTARVSRAARDSAAGVGRGGQRRDSGPAQGCRRARGRVRRCARRSGPAVCGPAPPRPRLLGLRLAAGGRRAHARTGRPALRGPLSVRAIAGRDCREEPARAHRPRHRAPRRAPGGRRQPLGVGRTPVARRPGPCTRRGVAHSRRW